jgi:hypothetical protein
LRKVALAELREVAAKKEHLGLHSPRILHLAYVSILTNWKLKAGPRYECSHEELMREREEALAWDEWILSGVLPLVAFRQRTDLRTVSLGWAQRRDQARWNMLGLATAQLKQNEVEFLEHTEAARDARKRALELARPILNMPEIRDEKDFAPELQRIFLNELPPMHKKTVGYSFIAAVASAIMGEQVTIDRVASFLKDPERVKGRARRGQVKSDRV